jgi:hypothetical protein
MEKLHTYVTSLGATETILMAHIGGCINDKVMVRLNIHGPHSNYRVQFARRPIYQANVVPQAKDLYDARQRRVYLKFLVDIQAVL